MYFNNTIKYLKRLDIASFLRLFAQNIRHAPVLRYLGPIWNLFHKPYLRALRILASRKGLWVTIGGYPMRIDPIFATVGWENVESESYKVFASEVKPRDVVFDVGASIGTYTIIALKKIGFEGNVVAYEPHDITRHYLLKHLKWNRGMARTIVRDCCCSSIVGKKDFYCIPGEAEGRCSLVPVKGFEKKTVSVTTLDLEVNTLGLIPSIIKIDVEGSEWDVLRGAESIIKSYRPRIFLSLHPPILFSIGATPEMVMNWLNDRNYNCKVIARDHEIHVFAKTN